MEHNIIVYRYKTAGGKDLILDYIHHLAKEEKVDGLSVLECMEQDRFDELTIKPWQGKVWEVYFYKHNRIFYVTVSNDSVYLLHACRKQKNKTEKTDAEIVKVRAKVLGIILNEKLI